MMRGEKRTEDQDHKVEMEKTFTGAGALAFKVLE